MARTIAQIQNQMIAAKDADAKLAGVTSPSKTAYWLLWTFIVAVGINLFEQILDIFKIDIEQIATTALAGTATWLRGKVFEFQYGDIAQLVNNAIVYPSVDLTKRIITKCSITVGGVGLVNIKVAKDDPPAPLTTPEKTALGGYVSAIDIAGVNFNIISQLADRLFVEADIYFDGQYGSTIEQDVIDALTALMDDLPFDGTIKVADVEENILSVLGVSDVNLKTIKARQQPTVFGSATVVYDLASGVNNLQWKTIAGYITQEDTGGSTFADSLNFIPE